MSEVPLQAPRSGRIDAVIVQYLPDKRCLSLVDLIRRESTEPGTQSNALFAKAYEVSDKFMFTPEYCKERQVKWLGKTHVDDVPGANSITINHVLVEDGFHQLLALHQHIAIERDIQLASPIPPETAELIRALHELYWLHNMAGESSPWARQVDPFFLLADHANKSLFARRAIYVSVLLDNADRALVPGWEEIAAPLYGLQKLHAEGVDAEIAKRALKQCQYSSTDFFVGFVDEEAAVTLAAPYPLDAKQWPFRKWPETEDEVGRVLACWDQRSKESRKKYEAYDLSPDYPALRYNAMALLEVVGSAAYAEWSVRRQLTIVMRRRGLRGLLSAVVASRNIDRTYFQARSLGILRLGVVRQIASQIIRARVVMEESVRAIDGMRASATNGLLAFLAASAVLLALVQIIIALSG